jgi:hypothetical protein
MRGNVISPADGIWCGALQEDSLSVLYNPVVTTVASCVTFATINGGAMTTSITTESETDNGRNILVISDKDVSWMKLE